MYRIIYLDLERGYKSADIHIKAQLQDKLHVLSSHGLRIICVIDLSTNNINLKCTEFDAHANFIKSCFPQDRMAVRAADHS